MTLLWKNIFRDKLRLALIVMAVAAVFLLYGFLASVYLAGSISERESAHRLVTSNKINFSQPLPISHFRILESFREDLPVTHVTWFGGYFRTPSSFVLASAVDAASYLRAYPEIVVSAVQQEDFLNDRGAVLIGRELAERFGWEVGQQIPLFSNIWLHKEGGRVWDFRVAGIYEVDTSSVVANYLLMHYDYLNATRSADVDTVGQYVSLLPDVALADEVSDHIDGLFTASEYPSSTVSESVYANYYLQQLGDVELIIILAVSASLVSIIVMVVNSMMISIRERLHELAILKAIGYLPERLFLLLFGEMQCILSFGGAMGLAFSAFAISHLSAIGILSGIVMPPLVWIMGGLLNIMLGLFTTLLPAFKVSRINIPQVFRRD